MIKYSEFRDWEANFNNITWYKDNINNQHNVTFYHILNETNPGFVGITVLELYKQKYIKK